MVRSTKEVIHLKDIQVSQSRNVVLSNVSFRVHRGEFYYLIGRTGSGKSSLLKVLYGENPIERGDGSVVGFDLLSLKAKDIPNLRRKIGIVFQDFQLLTDRNIYKNLEFVLKATDWKDKNRIEQRIDEVLSKVNMNTKKHKMPYEISGGEQQRVAIARSLLNDPELILADEPTGNLDPDTSLEIMSLLRNISSEGDCAVLMATHDYHLIQNFHGKAIKCENGQVSTVHTQYLF